MDTSKAPKDNKINPSCEAAMPSKSCRSLTYTQHLGKEKMVFERAVETRDGRAICSRQAEAHREQAVWQGSHLRRGYGAQGGRRSDFRSGIVAKPDRFTEAVNHQLTRTHTNSEEFVPIEHPRIMCGGESFLRFASFAPAAP